MGVYNNTRQCHKLCRGERLNTEVMNNNYEGAKRRVKVRATFKAFLSDKDFDNLCRDILDDDGNRYKAAFDAEKYLIKPNKNTVIARIGVFQSEDCIFFVDISNLDSERLKEGGIYMLYGKMDLVGQEIHIVFCNVMTDVSDSDDQIFDIVNKMLEQQGILDN